MYSKIHRSIRQDDAPRLIDTAIPSRAAPSLTPLGSVMDIEKVKIEKLLNDARAKATHTITEAEAKAQQIIAHAKSEAELLKKEAYTKGVLAAQNDYEDSLLQAEDIKGKAIEERLQKLLAADKDLIQLCLTITEHVLMQKVAEDDEIILTMVENAFRQVIDATKIAIKVAPEDYGLVVQHEQEFTNLLPGQSQVIVVANAKVRKGNCHIHTGQGEIEAGVDVGFQQVKDALLGLIHES